MQYNSSSVRGVRKIVNFDNNEDGFVKVTNEMDGGWFIVHITPNGRSYIAVLEKDFVRTDEEGAACLYLSQRKRVPS